MDRANSGALQARIPMYPPPLKVLSVVSGLVGCKRHVLLEKTWLSPGQPPLAVVWKWQGLPRAKLPCSLREKAAGTWNRLKLAAALRLIDDNTILGTWRVPQLTPWLNVSGLKDSLNGYLHHQQNDASFRFVLKRV